MGTEQVLLESKRDAVCPRARQGESATKDDGVEKLTQSLALSALVVTLAAFGQLTQASELQLMR
jgi:hypothetical protein